MGNCCKKEEKKTLKEIEEMLITKDKSIKNQNLDFQDWYPILKDLTMPSKMIELSSDEIKAIIYECEKNILKHNKNSDKYSNILSNLTSKYNQIITEFNNKCFIRYSHRSPKDSVFKLNQTQFILKLKQKSIEIYNKSKNISNNFSKQKLIINSLLIALVLIASEFQEMNNGNNAINFACYSKRIYRDLKIAELESIKTYVIFRQFFNLDFMYEFRLFIINGKLNIITQYHSLCYLIDIINNKNNIEKSIKEYWKNYIHDKMKTGGHVSYVVDICRLNDENVGEYKWIVIEVNPIGTNCGTGLFDWEKDWKCFFDERERCYFRVREDMFDVAPDKLPDGIGDMFNQVYQFMINETS